VEKHFASATPRPQSGKVLSEIAQVMHDHPTGSVASRPYRYIGGDASNLELSKRRAAAVVNSLASAYLLPQKQLTSTGFGVSRPVDINGTLEGRARNRRVELVKQ
jgi:flagellar motor protein MotB